MRVTYDETLCSSMMFFVTMPNFIIDREGWRIALIYDEIEIFVIKSNLL